MEKDSKFQEMVRLYYETKDKKTKNMWLKEMYEYDNNYRKDMDDVSEDIARVLQHSVQKLFPNKFNLYTRTKKTSINSSKN